MAMVDLIIRIVFWAVAIISGLIGVFGAFGIKVEGWNLNTSEMLLVAILMFVAIASFKLVLPLKK